MKTAPILINSRTNILHSAIERNMWREIFENLLRIVFILQLNGVSLRMFSLIYPLSSLMSRIINFLESSSFRAAYQTFTNQYHRCTLHYTTPWCYRLCRKSLFFCGHFSLFCGRLNQSLKSESELAVVINGSWDRWHLFNKFLNPKHSKGN